MEYFHHKIKICRLENSLVRLVISVMFFFASTVPVYSQTDLLKLPAKKSKFATVSHFFDIAKAGSRIVAVGERGHIVYSDDHGVNWTQADVPVRVSLTAVQFTTAKKGWVVGHDAVVLHSEDGGETWTKQLDGFQVNQIELALYQQRVKAKLYELAQAEETQKKDLSYELEDLQFKLEDVQFDNEQGAWKPLLDLWFNTNGQGYVVGVFGTILKTNDGGKTWQSISDRISNPDGYHYKNITRAGNALIVGGEIGNLYRSLDDGQTWEQLSSPIEASFFGMIADQSGDLVIGTSFKGIFVYSTDYGSNWTSGKAITMATIADGVGLVDGSLVIVSYAGEVFKIAVDGAAVDVQKIHQAKFPGMISVVATEDGHLVAAGLKGLLRIQLR